MGSTKAFRQPGATNPDGSKMLSGKHSYAKVNGITKANATATTTRPQPILTIQERLQDLSLTHWHLPIDSALELHLHGRLTVTNPNDNGTSKTLAPDSWTKWPTNYCKIMLKLVQLVSAEQANELLTAKLAAEGFLDREIGTQPRVVREVVLDVKKVVGRREGGVAKFGHDKGLVEGCRLRVVVGEVDVVLRVGVEVKVGLGVGRAVVARWRSEALEETVARWAGRQAMLVTRLD
jgi:hypothetical protein